MVSKRAQVGVAYKGVKFHPQHAGKVKCLGWCGKEFFSNNKRKQRFCARCNQKRLAAEQSKAGIRVVDISPDN